VGDERNPNVTSSPPGGRLEKWSGAFAETMWRTLASRHLRPGKHGT